jgi:hypothetical protein
MSQMASDMVACKGHPILLPPFDINKIRVESVDLSMFNKAYVFKFIGEYVRAIRSLHVMIDPPWPKISLYHMLFG